MGKTMVTEIMFAIWRNEKLMIELQNEDLSSYKLIFVSNRSYFQESLDRLGIRIGLMFDLIFPLYFFCKSETEIKIDWKVFLIICCWVKLMLFKLVSLLVVTSYYYDTSCFNWNIRTSVVTFNVFLSRSQWMDYYYIILTMHH